MNLFSLIPKVYAACPPTGACIVDDIASNSSFVRSLSDMTHIFYTLGIITAFTLGFTLSIWVFKR